MREIKFRAWNIKKKEFVKDDYYNQDREVKLDYQTRYLMRPSIYELSQFTGIKDKNGKEIYEGDIIEFDDVVGDGEDVCDVRNTATVVFDNHRYELCNFKYDDNAVLEEMYYNPQEDFIDIFKDCIVVGNIYEYSELIK